MTPTSDSKAAPGEIPEEREIPDGPEPLETPASDAVASEAEQRDADPVPLEEDTESPEDEAPEDEAIADPAADDETDGDAPEDDAPEPTSGDRAGTVTLFAIGPWLWGTLAACLAAQLLLTGLPLLFFYQPTPQGAALSLVELREASGFGFLRDLHLWASHGLLIAGWLHLLRVFALGSYRRTVGWSATVGLGIVAVLAAWTGSRLPSPAPDTPVLTFWVIHCVILPLVAAAIVLLWIRARRARA